MYQGQKCIFSPEFEFSVRGAAEAKAFFWQRCILHFFRRPHELQSKNKQILDIFDFNLFFYLFIE
jgi:hypothetical protein